MLTTEDRDTHGFSEFTRVEGERLRRALVAYYGAEVGAEAAAEAMVLAWERWAQIQVMENPLGYLFRAAQSRARPHIRWRRRTQRFPGFPLEAASGASGLATESMDLYRALAGLPPRQRAAVLLVNAYGYSHVEAADVLEVSVGTLNNLVHRGRRKLREVLGVME